MKNIHRKNGFSILAIILVIVVIIVAIGVWALSGQSNTSDSSTTNAKVYASTIINDSSSIKLAFDKLVINGTSKDAVTYTKDGNANSILNEAQGGISQITPPSNAINKVAASNDGIYVYVKEFYPNIIATPKRKAIILTGVTTAVCKQINMSLHSTEDIPEYISITNANQLAAGAKRDDPNSTVSVDFKINGMPDGHYTSGWTNGCITASNHVDQNVFFRILD